MILIRSYLFVTMMYVSRCTAYDVSTNTHDVKTIVKANHCFISLQWPGRFARVLRNKMCKHYLRQRIN